MNQIKYILLVNCIFFLYTIANAQDDALKALQELMQQNEDTQDKAYPAFKAMKIANLQSTKVAAKGDIYMYVSHRFGSVKGGIDTFFGLDNANTNIKMVYGLYDGLQIGLSRESLRRTYALSGKMSLKQQTKNFPVNLALYSTLNLNTELKKERYPNMKYADRLSYATQLLISRRFNQKFSVEFAPTFVRQNLVWDAFQDHNQYAVGLGARYKLSQRLSLNFDYVYNISRAEASTFTDPFTLGLDIETGGHVFQLLFSNAQSTNEPGFISNAEGSWAEGAVYFGFNIVRVF